MIPVGMNKEKNTAPKRLDDNALENVNGGSATWLSYGRLINA